MSLFSKLISGFVSKKRRAIAKAAEKSVSNVVSSFELLEGRAMMSASTPPAAPSDLTVSVASSTSVKLHWSDNSDRETGYKVERSTDGKSFSQLNYVAKDAETYTSGGLTKGKKYFYRVRAYSSGGNSTYTNVASAIPTATTVTTMATKAASATKVTKAAGANGGVGAYS